MWSIIQLILTVASLAQAMTKETHSRDIEQGDLRIACWNARGYLASIPYIKQLLSHCDILAISEHWVFESRLFKLAQISDSHLCFARASKLASAEEYGVGRGQGGVAIFWDSTIFGVTAVTDIILDRACAIRLQTRSGSIVYFVSVYLPAQGSCDSLDNSLDDITEVIESREEGAHIVVLGDFNGDVGSLGGPRGTRNPTLRGTKVMRFFDRHGLSPLNMQKFAGGPVDTYEGIVNGSTLDYIAVSPGLIKAVSQCNVSSWSELNTSDHFPVKAAIRLHGIARVEYVGVHRGFIKWSKLSEADKYFKYQRILNPIILNISRSLEGGPMSTAVINDNFNKLTEALHAASSRLPRSRFKKNLKPYWSHELSLLKRCKVESYRLWVSAGRPREADNLLYVQYKFDKKAFHTAIKRLSKDYENSEILKAVKSAEISKNAFWKIVSAARKGQVKGVSAIKRPDKTVVHDLNDVLNVWASHFAKIGTPKQSEEFDKKHFKSVTDFVKRYNASNELDEFLDREFTREEVYRAVKTLHVGKAPGFDDVMAEHLLYAGPVLINFLCDLYNAVRVNECIPTCFKRGVQVPLYKGKDTCVLDVNNYRGITLLPTYNKLFEILIWQRLKGWWKDEQVISNLQGACRGGFSCVHTAFNLRETVAASMESSNKCFVAFFDVAKAFDTVWIDGLFKQMYDLGITGRTWRLLYRGYVEFKCCVKLQGVFSEWYEPLCGIHQGGFMSLMKYVIFINSLLVDLKNANICCKIYRIPSTPLGYADDVATCCLSKFKLDKAMDIVYKHGCVWRYELNAKKSGVLVYGESRKDHDVNAVDRQFRLGPNRVKERVFYDHVGIRNSIFYDDTSGIEERISKGRKAFNSLTGIGIRKGGITMATCNVVFWSVVVPTALYGCELWIMDDASLTLVEDFQNYIGKRTQRFHPKTPNTCSFYGLGWMRLERYIQIKKLLFIRTILNMNEDDIPKRIFCERAAVYFLNVEAASINRERSAVFDLLNVSHTFDLLDKVRNMVDRDHRYSKLAWKDMVWRRGWELEDAYWRIEERLHKSMDLLSNVCPSSRYLNWWAISDKYPQYTKKCEILCKLLCHSSVLRVDDFKLKSQIDTLKMCNLCDNYQVEDVRHFILLCPYFQQERDAMINEINMIEAGQVPILNDNRTDMLYTILGRSVEGLNIECTERLCMIVLEYVADMYRKNVKSKSGIG